MTTARSAALSGRGNPRPLLNRKLRRDLQSSRWQVVAVIVTVTLGILLYAASFDAFRNLTASYQKTYDDLAFADLLVTGGDQQAVLGAALANDSVAEVAQRTQAETPVQVTRLDGSDHTLLGRLVGMPAQTQPTVNRVDVLSGDYLSPDDPTGVLVEKHMSDHFGLEPGDRVTIQSAEGPKDVTVRGTVASAEYLWAAQDRQAILSLPDQFGVLFAPEGLVTQTPRASQARQTAVLYRADADPEALDVTLSAAAREAGANDITRQEDQPSNAALSEDLAGFGELSFMFPVLFLSGAGFATFIILNRLVASQRGQIGVLMASGLTRREVVRHYLGYGLVLGLIGAALGLVVGIPAGALVTSLYTRLLSIPDTVISPSLTTPLIGVAFGLAMGVLSAWAPARAAVRVSPAAAMRGEIPDSGGARRSVFERVLPVLSRVPVRYRIGVRGIGRHKARSTATAGGVALAIILVLVSWGMIDTVNRLMDKQFGVVALEDAQVYLNRPVDQSAVAAVQSVPGVGSVETVISLGATLVADDAQYATQLDGYPVDSGMHGFVGLDGESVPLPQSGLLVGQAARDVIGLSGGDPVTVRFGGLGVEIDTTVVGFVDEPLGTYTYADQDWLVRNLEQSGVPPEQISSPAVTSLLVGYEPWADPDTTLRDLESLPQVAAAVSTTALRDLFDQYLALFYVFVGVMLVLGGILAFALIFNMIAATLAERAAELATMRASGLSVRQVNAMMTAENLLLTLIGIPIGLVLGYLTASVFMSSFSSDLFSFDLDMNPWTMVWTTLAVLVVALVSQVPGLRAIRRLDIATVVRQRSL